LFFESYPGLLKRIEREQKFAKKHGYTRTWVGPVRHLAELRYFKTNAAGNPIGADAKLYSRMYAHTLNQSCNTSIQTAEVYWAMPNITSIQKNLTNWGFKSRIFNFVHDSFEFYIYRPEESVVTALVKAHSDINRQPYYGIPMEMDGLKCDFKKGDMFKEGTEVSLENYDINVELEKWNKEHGTDLKFVSYVPPHGEVK